MILRKTNTQAKYKNGISYHLLLCFLAENETVSRVSTLKDFFLLRKFLQLQGKKRKYKIKGNMKEILKN